MREAQEPPDITVREAEEANSTQNANVNNQSRAPWFRQYKWWLEIAIHTIFVLAGQSAGTLLGRLYYDKGGNSKWMAAFVFTAGFPVLLPLLCFAPTESHNSENSHSKQPSTLILVSIYLFLGIFVAGINILYSIGLLYLPVSTFSLICTTQLGFNAFFSFFLNAQKFTPFIVNSLVLLTISSVLLVFQNDPEESPESSKKKYVIGFLCTVGASAGYGLMLSLTQLCFIKILKRETFRVVLDMIIYTSLVTTFATLVGLFGSGEWKSLTTEMEGFELGRLSYVMTLVWTAVSWQVYSIGAVALIMKVSSLFSNVIATLGLPIVPVLAVVFFHDKMDGVKVVAMLLAIWGFVSYIYQHYLDDLKSKSASDGADGEDQRMGVTRIINETE